MRPGEFQGDERNIMSDLDQAIAECGRHLHALGIKSSVPLEQLENQLREDVEQRMKSGLSERDAFEAAVDSARVIERLFVLGPCSRLTEGIVGVADAARWKSYLQHEKQPPLSGPAEVKSFLLAKRDSSDETQAAFSLEYYDPDMGEGLFPDAVTWRIYLRDVHGIEVDSTRELVQALRLAGWSEEQIARYSAIDLDAAIEGGPEFQEHTQKLVEADDVYVGPDENAFAVIQELTSSFPSESLVENVVGKLQLHIAYTPKFEEGEDLNIRRVGKLHYEPRGDREAFAVGELTLTALQELFNVVQSGIRVKFHRDADPPPWSESFWDYLQR
jgi:hypothetical protein